MLVLSLFLIRFFTGHNKNFQYFSVYRNPVYSAPNNLHSTDDFEPFEFDKLGAINKVFFFPNIFFCTKYCM